MTAFFSPRAPERLAGLEPSGSRGKPLAPGVRRSMEARLGHSFADVRVHADGHAAESARAVGARAYAVGSHVVFGAGQLSLSTPAGRARLAHELAHVVQQREPGAAPSDRAEAEARRAASAPTRPTLRTGRRLARQAEGEDEGPAVAEAPAAEALMRAQHAMDVKMFQDERLSLMRDRISATTSRIARGMDELRKRPENERPPLRAQIHAVEIELARALGGSVELLTARIPELEARIAAGEGVDRELDAARRDLRAAQADLETMKGVFSPEKSASFDDTYRNKVAGLHCMAAAYTGLGALTSPEVADQIKRDVDRKAAAGLKRKQPVNLDQFITIMNTASAAKLAGPRQRAAWNRKRQRWAPTLESLVQACVNTRVPGFYFFGFAVAEAFHSVLIGVSTWDEPRTMWCDQYGCTLVPGSLDDYTLSRLKAWEKAGLIHYHDWDSYLWQVLPPAAASLFPPKEASP